MKDQSTIRLGIIGTGKVGSALVRRLHEQGWIFSIIINRSIAKARPLAELCGAKLFGSIPSDSALWPDLWIISVKDDAIEGILHELRVHRPQVPAFHTSGSFDTQPFKEIYPQVGSLYPLQSISFGKEVDFRQVPFCVSAFDATCLETIKHIAGSISDQVYIIEDEDRLYLHLAAVFVNNFTNAMCQVAASILDEKDIPFHLLQPLLMETATKLSILTPAQAQTGPALRGDESTLNKHRAILRDLPHEYSVIYELMSRYISDNIDN